MGLREYQQKRDFAVTPEPPGQAPAGVTPRFYSIQKHDARRLHYDLRLELDGVLLSWAIPKGPSLDPAEKRLAVQTEDHPIEYGSFEGVIPEGEYGGGTVMLWDRGVWAPLDDAHEGIRTGKLKFVLSGQKLRGGFTLVRLKSGRQTAGQAGSGREWLLIKERDREARREDEYAVVDQAPFSVLTNRAMREIAASRDQVWHSGSDGGLERPAARRERLPGSDIELHPETLPRARRAAQPASLKPREPVPTDEPPDGENWLHEIELEGRRVLAILRPEEVRLVAPDREDWTGRLPHVARALGDLPIEQAILDGILVVLDAGGRSDRAALEAALASGATAGVIFHAFDLPNAGGLDLRRTPLEARKRALERLLSKASGAAVRYMDHVRGNGSIVYEHARQLGVKGLVSKRATSGYTGGATEDWVVAACREDDERARRGRAPGKGRPTAAFNEDAAGEGGTAEGKRATAAGATAAGAAAADAAAADAAAADAAGEAAAEQVAVPPRARARRAAGAAPAAGRASGVVAEPGLEIHGVRITNPHRVLYPEERVTKRVLARFYEQIADWILPHVVKRPLSLYRCPQGFEKDCFFQKHLGDMRVPHLREAPVREAEGKPPYLALDDVRGLIMLAQLATLEIHPWGCREDNIEKPDRMIFDLDPGPGASWRQIVDGARRVRERLADLGLECWVKTTGGKGLHVVAPLRRRANWDEVKALSQAVAKQVAVEDPRRFVITMAKWARENRVFIDYLRNVRGATAVAAYSTRARPGATVSTPLHWDELGNHPIVYTVHTLPRRLNSLRSDPWAGFFESRQQITKAMMNKAGRPSG